MSVTSIEPIALSAGLSGYSGLVWLREWVKLYARARWHRAATHAWLTQLSAQPLLTELLRTQPRLVHKVYRPYFSTTLTHTQRIDVLATHYRFIAAQGLGSIVRRAARGPLHLGSVKGKSGTAYVMQLCAISALEREGELVLQLLDNEGLLYSAAFCFLRDGMQMQVGLACVQGPNYGDRQARVRTATRDLDGLRPKSLMVKLVEQWGRDHGCRSMLLVGNGNRPVHSAIRQGKVHADYDALWRELGAQRRSDGNFVLPCDGHLPATAKGRQRHAMAMAFCDTMRSGLQGQKHLHAIMTLAADWTHDLCDPVGGQQRGA